jgi:hypothetical protein
VNVDETESKWNEQQNIYFSPYPYLDTSLVSCQRSLSYHHANLGRDEADC